MLFNLDTVVKRCMKYNKDLLRTEAESFARQYYQRVCHDHPWPFRRTRGCIEAVADYTTGTISVTQESKDFTIAAATLTQAMVGRHIRVTDDTIGYEIETITGATTGTFRRRYEGTTDAAATYEMRQLLYKLPRDFGGWEIGKESGGLNIVEDGQLIDLESNYQDRWGTGTVETIVEVGTTRESAYSTGTVTLQENSTTATFGGATLLEARDRNARLRIKGHPDAGDFIMVSINAGAGTAVLDRAWRKRDTGAESYDIDPAGERLVELRPSPAANTSVEFTYFRLVPPIVSDFEWPLIPAAFQDLWLEETLFALQLSDGSALLRLRGKLLADSGLKPRRVVKASPWGTQRRGGGSVLPDNFPYTRPAGR